MASSMTATPDTMITLKVNFDGATRRFKLPLRELVVHNLEDKLRSFLHIPVGAVTTFERYSDSAASFVVLDPANISAYKQLYRAAKAKQKLKLRVTTQTRPEPETKSTRDVVPKPATVEDEIESESKETVELTSRVSSPTTQSIAPEADETQAGILNTVPVSEIHSNLPNFIHLWRIHGMPKIHLRKDAEGTEVVDLISSASPAVPAISLDPHIGAASIPGATNRCPFARSTSMSLGTDSKEACGTEQTQAPVFSKGATAPPARDELKSPQTEEEEDTKADDESLHFFGAPNRPFTVCCNSCDKAVPDAHFHCATCDDGDFDLCEDCINRGITCYGDGHWLIKRTIKDGQINYSTTHIAPKANRPQPDKEPFTTSVKLPIRTAETAHWAPAVPSPVLTPSYTARTCNCCVQDFPDKEFLHCTTCEDYDLCKSCFAKDKHGHHPKHGFTPVVKGTVFEPSISSRLSPGRDANHNAICDGCDQFIRGVRHKCLDCPDWDYCSECVQNADFVHANHRFVAIYEPLPDRTIRPASCLSHYGICCDGPLCTSSASRGGFKYIVGVRYKCAVCHDTDFCADCEASPSNNHNKTHPLIKFKTPVRHVSVTTTGEHENGYPLPTMGDRTPLELNHTEAAAAPQENISATSVQTVVDVKPIEQEEEKEEQQPSEPEKTEEIEIKKEEVVDTEVATLVEKPSDLVAVFKHDTVADGTIFPPNHTFEQVWVLRNEGTSPWPAGCSVKFVGGDYMGAIDPTHPAGIHELVSASESTICYNALNPGQEFPFTVLMRTPDREGKVISYWRLTTPDGIKFGHKLWCDVTVEAPIAKAVKAQPQPEVEGAENLAPVPEMTESRMIIPKLEHESPSASVHEKSRDSESDTLAQSSQGKQEEEEDDFEDCGEDEEWAESEDGFMTDEEYDILDASDEEYLLEQRSASSRK
ncbi:hypothetical protein GGS23DRAFT_239547 [Durotheca rogersii]|uniref:uncharacterized protein n=1 Tax=Durotheca rogersii TaxID=419775 RepID=UPI00221F4561|nr:uncharacterized protein GGS23DRAFT_239547 [Durotheca rogersii]KAI5860206.1 hypothetical protein GGS23DRAFT_239547 [Durotheca rogersii]